MRRHRARGLVCRVAGRKLEMLGYGVSLSAFRQYMVPQDLYVHVQCRPAISLSIYIATPYHAKISILHPTLPIQPQFLHQRLNPPQQHSIVHRILCELIPRHLTI